ncbi:hypothetical protein GCM10012286_51390 [Streptomyces lasiicapitis]|uniref:Uncharacterized protein n=1 Tax=Streptomyces lasiicapitis TaxID=1923961 RepID=A0ABQ2MFI5_9ACTN|nr:hypothetical protein GCM10012286_51390 [Streptomyces lasiicapitis]
MKGVPAAVRATVAGVPPAVWDFFCFFATLLPAPRSVRPASYVS